MMDMEGIEKIDQIDVEVVEDKTLLYQDFMYKLILLGSSGVGKTSILMRATQDTFIEEHHVTLGVEFGTYLTRIENKLVRIQIWDTAGQESFKSITRIFYKGAHCVFLVYDVTRPESFEELYDWLKEVKQHSSPDIKIFLIGNVIDKETERKISTEKGLQMKRDNDLYGFIETSAKSGKNVKDVFITISKLLYSHEKAAKDQALKEFEQDMNNNGFTLDGKKPKKPLKTKMCGCKQQIKLFSLANICISE